MQFSPNQSMTRLFFPTFLQIFRVSGTPTEETWAGVSRLPNYRPHKMCYYRGVQRLGHAWPRLLEVFKIVLEVPCLCYRWFLLIRA